MVDQKSEIDNFEVADIKSFAEIKTIKMVVANLVLNKFSTSYLFQLPYYLLTFDNI